MSKLVLRLHGRLQRQTLDIAIEPMLNEAMEALRRPGSIGALEDAVAQALAIRLQRTGLATLVTPAHQAQLRRIAQALMRDPQRRLEQDLYFDEGATATPEAEGDPASLQQLRQRIDSLEAQLRNRELQVNQSRAEVTPLLTRIRELEKQLAERREAQQSIAEALRRAQDAAGQHELQVKRLAGEKRQLTDLLEQEQRRGNAAVQRIALLEKSHELWEDEQARRGALEREVAEMHARLRRKDDQIENYQQRYSQLEQDQAAMRSALIQAQRQSRPGPPDELPPGALQLNELRKQAEQLIGDLDVAMGGWPASGDDPWAALRQEGERLRADLDATRARLGAHGPDLLAANRQITAAGQQWAALQHKARAARSVRPAKNRIAGLTIMDELKP